MDIGYALTPIITVVLLRLWVTTTKWPPETYSQHINWSKVDRGFLYRVSAALLGSIMLLVLAVPPLLASAMYTRNLVAIVLAVVLLQLVRGFLEIREDWGEGRAPLAKLASDSTRNLTVFITCYAATTTAANTWLVVSGVILAVANLLRAPKFRLDDDFKYGVHKSDSKRYRPTKSNGPVYVHVFMRGVIDQILRSYLYTAFSFTVLQMLLMGCDDLASSACAFRIDQTSGNRFLDFFYFNIVTMFTVGYGDITPRNEIAKLLSCLEIIFSGIILASIVALFIDRIRQVASDSPRTPPSNLPPRETSALQ